MADRKPFLLRVDPALLEALQRWACDDLRSLYAQIESVDATDPEATAHARSLTHGGVEYALELAGSTRALDLAFGITRRGGTTITAGLPDPSATLPLSPLSLVAEERTLKGSYIGTAVPSRDIPRYIELYQRGRLPVDRLLSGTSRLSEINHGFDLLDAGQVVRHVITM